MTFLTWLSFFLFTLWANSQIAGLQVVSMGLIAHVAKTSSMFAHHQYGASFIFSNVSWGVAAILSIGVLLYAKYGAQGYIALE